MLTSSCPMNRKCLHPHHCFIWIHPRTMFLMPTSCTLYMCSSLVLVLHVRHIFVTHIYFPWNFGSRSMGIVDPNELWSSFSTVLHTLQSGIVFAVFFFPPCYSILVVHNSLIHNRVLGYSLETFHWWVTAASSRGPTTVLSHICLELSVHSILPTVCMDSFDDHLVSVHDPLPLSHGGLQLQSTADDGLAQTDPIVLEEEKN